MEADATGAVGITFGGWLKQRRKEPGINHDKFAELTGCSVISLLKIEAGKRRPSRQLAEILVARRGIQPKVRLLTPGICMLAQL